MNQTSRAGGGGASSTKNIFTSNEKSHNDKIMAECGGRQHGLEGDGGQGGHIGV